MNGRHRCHVIQPHTSVAGSSLLISLTVSTVTYSGAGSSSLDIT